MGLVSAPRPSASHFVYSHNWENTASRRVTQRLGLTRIG